MVAVSWWGPEWRQGTTDTQGVSTDAVLPALLAAAEEERMSVAFHLEPYPGRNASSTREDLLYLMKRVGASPAVLRLHRDGSRLVSAGGASSAPASSAAASSTGLPLFYVYDSYAVVVKIRAAPCLYICLNFAHAPRRALFIFWPMSCPLPPLSDHLGFHSSPSKPCLSSHTSRARHISPVRSKRRRRHSWSRLCASAWSISGTPSRMTRRSSSQTPSLDSQDQQPAVLDEAAPAGEPVA